MSRDDEATRRIGTQGHSIGRIEHGHRSLRSRLDALTGAADRAGVLSGLQELPKMLGEHFADEEVGGGLYDDLARRRPRLLAQLDVLRGEHRAILAELETLIREIQSDPAPGGVLSEATRRGINRCAERLRRHEHDESTMIVDVYYTDEGGPG